MPRACCVLLLLLVVCQVLAAPAPEPFKSGWERAVDPSRDCKFVIKGDRLTIELPGGDHELAPKRGRFNAPRLLREVNGDFVAQVRVSSSFHLSAKSSIDGEEPSVAAGLVLIPADENCIRLEYGTYRKKGDQRRGVNYRMRGGLIYNMEVWGWMPGREEAGTPTEGQIYLRLERRKDVIYHFISFDGENWVDDFNVGPIEDLPRKVKVGLAACSTSTEPFKATFDQFKLIRSRKKGP